GAVGALDGTLIHARVPINKQHLYREKGKGDCYRNVLAICDFNMMFTFLVAGWEGVAHDSRILSESIRNQNAPFLLPPPAHFSILKRMAHFSLTTQKIACFALHNFIRKKGLDDELFSTYDNVQLDNENVLVEDDGGVEEDQGAVGALDGTLIHACVPINKQHLYKERGKGDCYRNVLAICDFNIIFTFLVAGWEGVAHDSRILSEAIRNENAPFLLPPPVEDDGGVEEDQVVQSQGNVSDREYMTNLRDQIAQQLMQSG
nr:hypothetical protein [Tanacetum cinerariifolium]